MGNKSEVFWKAVGLLTAYGVIMAAVIFFLNDCRFDRWKAITWSIFMVFGMWQCYRWYQNKVEEQDNKED